MSNPTTLLIENNIAKLRMPEVEWCIDLMRAPACLPLSLEDALGMGTCARPVEPVSKGSPGPQVEYGMQMDDLHEYFLSGAVGPAGVLVSKRRDNGWVSTMSKSLLPFVLSKQAVKEGLMPPEGMSALPKSLERVVPVRLRYWEQPAAQAVVVRNALAKSGMIEDRLLKLVDGDIRLCVERLYLYEPEQDVHKNEDDTFVKSLHAAVNGCNIVQPFLSPDWKSELAKHTHDAHAFLLLSSPQEDVTEVVDALITAQPVAKWLVEYADTPVGRAQLSKLGRLFTLEGFNDHVFVSSVSLSGAQWLDDVPDTIVQKLNRAVVLDALKNYGPPNEWSGAVAALAGEELRKEMNVLWDSLSKDEQAAVQAEWEHNFTLTKILKAGDEHYVLGIILEPEQVDAQNDIYSAEEIRNAAHVFMEKYRTMGLMHKQGVNDRVKILESYVAPSDMEIQGVPIKSGTWLMAVRVMDDGLWKQVKDGDLTGFSIGGSAIRRLEVAQQPTNQQAAA